MAAGSVCAPTVVPLRLPTRSKQSIDASTPIELRTETQGTDIYYTVNGTKPQPFQKLGEKHTYAYKRPFSLLPGKQTVKAIAIQKDPFRESSIVTKTFIVSAARNDNLTPPQSRSQTFFDDDDDDDDDVSSDGNKFSSLLLQPAESKLNRTGPKYLTTRLGPLPRQPVSGGNSARPASSRAEAQKLLKQTDFLKCVQCFSPRPADPYARFCPGCGSPVPPLPSARQLPPRSGEMGTCLYCHSSVPLSAPACLTCEAPIPPQLRPQAIRKLQAKLLCTRCSTVNPPEMQFCVTCEARLQDDAAENPDGIASPEPPPPPSQRTTKCTKCGRQIARNARFCDWCGTTKPVVRSSQPVACKKCSASNQPSAQFCSSCGSGIESRPVSPTASEDAAPPPPVASPSKEVRTQGTQTQGLFFKSSRALEAETKAAVEAKMQSEAAKDRRLTLTTFSPGRGYWRQQIDHVCSHVKAYTQNSLEFQKLLGQPQMGKLRAATIHNDGEEVTLTLAFPLKGARAERVATSTPLLQTSQSLLSTLSESGGYNFRNASLLNLVSQKEGETSLPLNDTKALRKKKSKSKRKGITKMSAENQMLFQEVGVSGKGRVEIVQGLLDDDGSNANICNKDGLGLLAVACLAGRLDCIQVLVDKGADVNMKMRKGNTALHECVLAGPRTIKSIEVLLGCSASADVLNDAGEKPYDIAIRKGYEEIEKCLMTNVGISLLGKMTKPNMTL
ncbi:double zinc ribbon and ankyrin repeat-containing protein 1-like [Oscarella lobularis]|uniref:double zinc ribbon and ankyrin repeat-containing protein 1-like n=1 Tax=Oscarella lobularis TaxID=121494 RepID=UPI003313722D